MKYITSESVLPGHPDKVCDYIADSILDAHLEKDPESRVACEVLAKGNHVVLAGEITSKHHINHKSVVKQALDDLGYGQLHVAVADLIQKQIPALADNAAHGFAGDQGVMVGYACDETPTLMPMPSYLAHKIAKSIDDYRIREINLQHPPLLLPDGKCQITIAYENDNPVYVKNILASVQHVESAHIRTVRFAVGGIIRETVGDWFDDQKTELLINPQRQPFTVGGPVGDCGLTGRKIVIDAYGGSARVGGGCQSGKSCEKVDRSAFYAARYVSRKIVLTGLAKRVETSVAYSIGKSEPLAVSVDTFGTGNQPEAQKFAEDYDWRPLSIKKQFGLTRPIYKQTTNFGHFGRANLPWEQ